MVSEDPFTKVKEHFTKIEDVEVSGARALLNQTLEFIISCIKFSRAR